MYSNYDSGSSRSRSIRFRRMRLERSRLASWSFLRLRARLPTTSGAYRNSLAATDRELDNVARALAEQTAWTWQGIDLLLRDTARWYQNDGRNVAPERVGEVLANRAAGMRQIRLLTIVDAQGIQRYLAKDPPRLAWTSPTARTSRLSGMAPRGAFSWSEPLVTRSENRAAVELSRRLDDDTGFAGVVTAVVDLGRSAAVLSSRQPGSGQCDPNSCARTGRCWYVTRRRRARSAEISAARHRTDCTE